MSHRASALLLVCMSLATACVSPETRFRRSEESYRDTMAARYLAGSTWVEPDDKVGTFTRWNLTEPAPDGFAARALEEARRRHGDVVTACEYGAVLRTSLGSSFGAFGLFVDYVFLDADERVLVAYRCWLD